jgi:hypothetical protein
LDTIGHSGQMVASQLSHFQTLSIPDRTSAQPWAESGFLTQGIEIAFFFPYTAPSMRSGLLIKQFLCLGILGFCLVCVSLAVDVPQAETAPSLEQRLADLEKQVRDLEGVEHARGSGIKISGYVDTSYIMNMADRDHSGPVAGSSQQNTGRVYDLQYNAFNLDAVEIWIEKEKDESRFPAGFRIDLVYGEKANVLDASNAMNDSKFFVEQAYVTLGVPIGSVLEVQMGKFCTLPGYEQAERCFNWCFSFSDGARLLPGSHAGVLLNYQWTDWMKSSVGVVNGWDGLTPLAGSVNYNTDFAFIGRVDFMNLQCGAGEFIPWISGYYGNDDRNVTSRNSANINVLNAGTVWNQPFQCKPLAVTFEYVHRNEDLDLAGAGLGTPPVEADSVSFFGKWDWTDWTATAGRFSYSLYQNHDGAGLDPLVVFSGVTRPEQTELYAFVLCQRFTLWKDVLLRLEWEHDWTPTSQIGYGVASSPGRDDLRHEQDTLAVNVVVSF